MKALFGWTGSVLSIDLTTKQVSRIAPNEQLYRQYLGGRGLAGHFLLPHADREYTDPQLPLLFFTGPLTGTDAPTSGRGCFLSRSPLTGGVADANVGGSLATRLKQAGYDGLIITGQSETPCGIEIDGSEVRIVVTDLWGQTCNEVFTQLRGANPDSPAIACIGPAGENGALLAAIQVDRHHAASRCGLGCVMGTKQLKYISILGSNTPTVHDPQLLGEAREEILRLTAASPVLMGAHGFANKGTAALFDLTASRHMMPTDNFTATHFSDSSSLNAASLEAMFAPANIGSMGCHIQCKRVTKDGRSLPDFDALSHFTALIGNRDLSRAVVATNHCADLGLDPISAASTLACLREITGQDFTDATLLDHLDDMACGGPLGQGADRFAAHCGRPDKAMAIKGLELPGFDPRGGYGLALAYAVNTRGGCYRHAYPISHEILRKPVATDRFSFSGKGRIIKLAEDMYAAADSLTACQYIFFAAGPEEFAKAYTAVTGVQVTGHDLMATGARIVENERRMNQLNGFTAADDDLPERFFTTPGTAGGGFDVPPIDREEFLAARANYYAVRGLDENGLLPDDTEPPR